MSRQPGASPGPRMAGLPGVRESGRGFWGRQGLVFKSSGFNITTQLYTHTYVYIYRYAYIYIYIYIYFCYIHRITQITTLLFQTLGALHSYVRRFPERMLDLHGFTHDYVYWNLRPSIRNVANCNYQNRRYPCEAHEMRPGPQQV